MGSSDDLAAEIEGLWALTDVRIIGTTVSYPTRRVLRLSSDQGHFAAKVFDDVDAKEVTRGVQALLAVRSQGFASAPSVLTTTAGDVCRRTSAGATLLMELIPDTSIGSTSAATWAEFGATTATLNTHTCETAFAIPVDASLRDQVTRADATEYATDVRALAQRLDHLGSATVTGVIHGEVNPANAGRRTTGELVLLDWDQAGMGPTALEYGYPLIHCLISERLHVDEDAIRSFYDAYRSSGGVVDVALAIDAALFHALRYMWFANTAARWQRIQFALDAEADLAALIA